MIILLDEIFKEHDLLDPSQLIEEVKEETSTKGNNRVKQTRINGVMGFKNHLEKKKMSNNKISNLTEEERQWIIEHPKEVSEMIIKRVDLMNKVSPILEQIKGKVDNKVYSTILWKIVDIEEERQGLENRVKELRVIDKPT